MSDDPIRLQLDENPDPEPQHTTEEASPEEQLREKLKRLEETRLLLEEKRRQKRTYLETENEKLNTISLNGLPPKKRRIWTSKWMIICYILIFLAAGGAEVHGGDAVCGVVEGRSRHAACYILRGVRSST